MVPNVVAAASIVPKYWFRVKPGMFLCSQLIDGDGMSECVNVGVKCFMRHGLKSHSQLTVTASKQAMFTSDRVSVLLCQKPQIHTYIVCLLVIMG